MVVDSGSESQGNVMAVTPATTEHAIAVARLQILYTQHSESFHPSSSLFFFTTVNLYPRRVSDGEDEPALRHIKI
jgi:hypothetical protein